MFLTALLLALAILTISVLATIGLRKILGHEWLERLALGVQHFDGYRPVWIFDELERNRIRGSAGVESLLLSTAVAESDFSRRDDTWTGRVRTRGESWMAESHEDVRAGENVRVSEVRGLVLKVERPNSDPRAA